MGSEIDQQREEEAEGQDQPAEPVAAVGATAERRGHPQASQGTDRRRGRRGGRLIDRRTPSRPLRRAVHGSDEERDGQMAMTEERAARTEHGRTRQGGRRRPRVDREAVRPRRDHEARVAREARAGHDPDRLDRARPGARRRRHPARPDHRDLRAGIVGQDDRLPARPGGGPGARRRRRLHRRRARARSRLRPGLRRQRR